MAKTWVLDSETKGTGAHVAPLPTGPPARERELSVTRFRPPPREPAPPPARAPRSFKVVDVLGNRVIADDVPAARAIAALAQLRKALDARVYVREPGAARWRLLTLGETRALWELRGGSASRSPGRHGDSAAAPARDAPALD
jgi:hypothetical protein